MSNILKNNDEKIPLLCIREFIKQTITSQEIRTIENKENEYFLLYVEDGQSTVYYDGEFVGIKQSDFLLIDLSKEFYYSSNYLKSISCIVGGIVPKEIEQRGFIYSIKNNNVFQSKLLNLAMEDKYNQVSLLQCYLRIINDLNNPDNSYRIRNNEDSMQRAIRFIENNFNKHIDLEMIAESINFSKYHFIRKFKEYTGLTPYQYVIELRLEHSKYLLQNSMKRISDIAIESGFASEINYINCFKNKVKLTPTTFRKNKGEKQWVKNY